MRMTDRQAQELLKEFTAKAEKLGLGQCMDCDDHPDEEFDGYCSERCRTQGYIERVIGVTQELLRYKALARRYNLPEPVTNEAELPPVSRKPVAEVTTSHIVDSTAEATWLNIGGHEWACDHFDEEAREIAKAVNELPGIPAEPSDEVKRLAQENALLHDQLEEQIQRNDEGVLEGDKIRVFLTRSLGYFTKSPTEMAAVVAKAVQVAKQDPEFKSYYDELQAQSRQRILAQIKSNAEAKALAEKVETLSADLSKLEEAIGAKGVQLAPKVKEDMKKRLHALAGELAIQPGVPPDLLERLTSLMARNA